MEQAVRSESREGMAVAKMSAVVTYSIPAKYVFLRYY
jgi:hypothetical protein